MSKQNGGLGNGIIKMIKTATSLVSIVGQIKRLLESEVRTACKSLFLLTILFLFAICIFSSLWLSALAMLFVYFLSLQISMQLSLFIIFLLNIILLLIVLLIATKAKKQLTFTKTRRLLRSLFD